MFCPLLPIPNTVFASGKHQNDQRLTKFPQIFYLLRISHVKRKQSMAKYKTGGKSDTHFARGELLRMRTKHFGKAPHGSWTIPSRRGERLPSYRGRKRLLMSTNPANDKRSELAPWIYWKFANKDDRWQRKQRSRQEQGWRKSKSPGKRLSVDTRISLLAAAAVTRK